MEDIHVSAGQFKQLIEYLDQLGLNVESLCNKAGMNYSVIVNASPKDVFSAHDYSRIYLVAAREMERSDPAIPWAGGIGTEAFEIMCHALMSCHTLGQALRMAVRFERILSPLTGRSLQLEIADGYASLIFMIDAAKLNPKFIPAGWSSMRQFETAATVSGLALWQGLSGWLVGRSIEVHGVELSSNADEGSYPLSYYTEADCPVHFEADSNKLVFGAEHLTLKLVQTVESLNHFLEDSVYQLIVIGRTPVSTSAEIKSIVGVDLEEGLPTLGQMARRLHMSESSLRRRLINEGSSYQEIKDEIRHEVAINQLRRGDIKIGELSSRLGYADVSSFVRSFKSWTGMTPNAYREKILSQSE